MDDELIALFNDTFQAKSMIFVPLKIRGEWIGFIHGLFPTRTTINPTEEQGLKTLASQTAVVVQGINQLEFLREKARRDQILAEITSRIYNATDPETILRITAQQVGQALGRKTMIYLDPEE